jgi:hypothetical protein
MDTVVDHYEQAIDHLRSEPADHPSLHLAAVNLDTGHPSAPGTYPLADQTYARYLAALVNPHKAKTNVAQSAMHARQSPQSAGFQSSTRALPSIDPAIRGDIEHYFANTRRSGGVLQLKKGQWKDLDKNLLALHRLPAASLAPVTEQVSGLAAAQGLPQQDPVQ